MSSLAPALTALDLDDLDQACGGIDWMEAGGAALRGATTGGSVGMGTGLAIGSFLGAPLVGAVAGGAGGLLTGAVVGGLENILQQPPSK